jgi:hypothetical protein
VRRLAAVVLFFVALPGVARAQTCFRPQPRPACEAFTIAELSIERRAGTLTGGGRPRWQPIGSGAFGGMVNVAPRWAVGAALVKVGRSEEEPGDDEAASRVGVVLRARRWLGDVVSLDLSGGLWRLQGARPTLEVAVEAGGVIGVTVGVRGDRLLPRSGEAYLGVRFSSYAAVMAGTFALLQAFGSLAD